MTDAALRMVIVGGSLAGLSAAQAAREAGWTGALTVVGAERHAPYNRPPLSKQLLLGELTADATRLPADLALDADWRLGAPATALHLAAREVELGDGTRLTYDRMLIATGAEARRWPKRDQARLRNVHVLRSLDDALALRAAFVAGPRRVLVIGGGFIACEVASACSALGIPVVMATPTATPLESVLGVRIGAAVAALHQNAGVELVCGERIVDLVGDVNGQVTAGRTDSGAEIEADLVVLALGAVRNTGWLTDAGLRADERGLDCDGDGRVLDRGGHVVPDVFAAGDVARFPHPLYGDKPVALEHWGHALAHGAHVGRVMAGDQPNVSYNALPTFWSTQQGVNIKSVGLTDGADAVVVARGDLSSGRFVAVYGRRGRCIAAVSFDSARWLPLYADMIARRAAFPPASGGIEEPSQETPSQAFEGARRVSQDRLFDEIKDEANRPDPYSLYGRLRETPVSRQHDGTYVVSTHAAVARLLGDPRVSSETLPPAIHPHTGNPVKDWIVNPLRNWITDRHRPFIFRDPPDHDSLRAAVMHEFTAERVQKMRRRSQEIVDDLLAKGDAKDEFDVVADFAYPLPVTVICEILGVPAEDEPKFSGWSTQLASALEPDSLEDRQNREENSGAFDDIADYMKALVAKKRKEPQDDILSGLAAKSSPETKGISDYDVISTAILLLIAGHETTVNLIANGTLALTRHADELARLVADPGRGARVVEEVMRFDPPVQFRTRKTLDPIEIEGVTIPEGAPLALLLASGNRDPSAYREPDRLDPDRTDNRHLGFGGGLHYCVGAPLARFEAEIALTSLARLLTDRRLVADPPPYRPGASLRGPKSLIFAR